MKEIDKIEFINYTKTEEKLNTISHIFGAVLAIVATIMTVVRSLSIGRNDYLELGYKKLAKYYNERELEKVLVGNAKKIIS